jgi:peptidoglycan/LPS O-acetylase OafA/YrhL
LFLSLAISFCSILLFLHFGLSVIHENSIFLFFIFEFAFGIFIGYRLTCHPIIESKIKIVLLMLLGVLFYSISYYLVTKTSWGENFNKPFTSLGLLFITYSLFFVIQRLFPMLFKYFKEISSSSYYMYLIHFPIVYYFLSKIKTNFSDSIFINLAAFVFTYAIFCCCIYFVSKKTENVINGIMRHFSAEIKS